MDESLFVKINGIKKWIIVARNNKTWNIRVEVLETRSENDIRLFISNHIKNNNNIITDGWSSYSFLDNPNSNYTHETFVHGPNGNFGFGNHSTSPIESVWSTLQSYIKRIYNIIPFDNFILFLRESELRYNFRKKTSIEIEKEIKEIMLYLYISAEFDLYSLDELESNDNYDW